MKVSVNLHPKPPYHSTLSLFYILFLTIKKAKMKKKGLMLFVLLLVGMQFAFAQTRHIKGKVLDETGQGLPGASIAIKGTVLGTVTDVDGNFEIDVPNGDKMLLIKALGYASQDAEITADGIIINMKTQAKELNETVVTALGIKREKKALAFATQTVDGEQLNNSGTGNPLSELEGKVSGLTIINSAGDPGAGTYMQLRGVTSLTGDNAPLIIVDGIPIDNSINAYDPTNAGFQASGANGNLTGGAQATNRGLDINPNDIESINVLKGPAATALYGIKAAAGALIITTKKGNSPGQGKGVHVSVNSSYSVDEVNKLPELQNKYSQGSGNLYMGPSTGKSTSWGAAIDTLFWDGKSNDIDKHGNIVGKSSLSALTKVTPYNPYDFFQTGTSNNNNIALSGGDDKASFRMSFGDLRQFGTIPNTRYNKNTIGLNGQIILTDKLSISAGANYVKSENDKAQQGSNISALMLGLMRTPPTYDNANGVSNPASNSLSYLDTANNTQRNYRGGAGYDNPYWSVNRNKFVSNLDRFYGYTQVNYKLLDWIDLTYRLGGDVYTQSDKNAYDIYSRAFPAGAIYMTNYSNSQFNSDIIVNMHKTINKDFNAALTLGQNYFDLTSKSTLAQGTTLTLPNFLDMSNASNYFASESEGKLRRMAYYGQGELDYKNYLFLTLSGRDETSSTLPANKNNFFYPSAGLSYVFTEPLGLTGSPILSYGKLRLSDASVGKDAPPLGLVTYYHSAGIQDGFTPGITWPFVGSSGYEISNAVTVIGNPNLKPEHTNSFEIGTDLAFFHSRLNLSATYYYSKTTDGIFQVPVPYSAGFGAELMNAATISNKGLELSLNTTPIKTKSGFRWDLNFNWTKNVNEVVSLSNGLDQLFISGFQNGGIYAVPGQAFGVIMGNDYVRDSKGNLIINDVKGDPGYGMPIVGTKNVALGNINPNWIGSMVNSFSFKGFSLGVQIDMRSGGQIWNGTRGALSYFGKSAETLNRNDSTVFSGYMGHVDISGNVVHGAIDTAGAGAKNTYYAKTGQYYWQNLGSSFIGPGRPSVEDGSWLRLRQISLTYVLPTSLIKKAHIHSMAVTVYMNNIILWTKYKGVDPETSLSGPANGQGMDYFNNPGIKSYGLRLNLGL